MKQTINDFYANLNSAYNATTVKAILKAEGYTNEQISSLNLQSKKSTEIDAYSVMNCIIENEDKMSRKQIAQELYKQNLCSIKTGEHILSLMKFCKAYHDLMTDKQN